MKDVQKWVLQRIPKQWFVEPPEVRSDGEETLIVGRLPARGESAGEVSAIRVFRESTRAERVRIASEMEQRFGRPVSWGVRCGEARESFTTPGVPVMTRLRMPEREVLDTLIAAGVARTRSEALAWCVRLVGEHEGDWLKQLRDALQHVHQVRNAGPRPKESSDG